MSKGYNPDPGYVTVPEADKIVLRILKVLNKDGKSHYNKLLEGAKKGCFGGKKYGSRMYQVRREDVVQYAEEFLRDEKLNLLNIDIVTETDKMKQRRYLSDIDQNTAQKLYYYIKSLKFHEIISEETYRKAEKTIVLRLNIGKINKR